MFIKNINSKIYINKIQKFLKSESINFKVYPAFNYTQLQKNIQQTKIYSTVKLFLFINCGGTIDLTEKWFINNTSTDQNDRQHNSHVFLFDINKPIHHKNIDSPYVFVVDDQNSQMEKRVTGEQMRRFQQLEEFDLDQQELDDNYDDDQEDKDSQKGSQSPKRNSQKLLFQKLKKKKLHLEQKISNYYNYTFFSLPTSYIIYRLVRELHKNNNYSLWFAIIGMTCMYLQNNIHRDHLQQLTSFYRSDMIKFNPQNNQKRQKGQIYTRKGYQFPLLNHWSLYDSMMNSNYLMIKLQLWKDKGLNTLNQILTKIGISLSQAKQQYKYMLKQSKQALEENIFKIAEWYKLQQITFESFMRQADSSSAYMASDYYYLLLGVLQRPLYKSNAVEMSEHRLNCFWDAYSVLDGSQQMIKKSIEQYKEMSRVIMNEVRDVIQRDNIIALKKIHFANIRCDNKQKRLFQHQSTLMRFAFLLNGIQRQRRMKQQKQKKQKSQKSKIPKGPFIVSLMDIDKNICTIIGVQTDYKSKLGSMFNYIVTHMKISVQHDRFVSNVLVIPKQNLTEFIKKFDELLEGKRLEQIK